MPEEPIKTEEKLEGDVLITPEVTEKQKEEASLQSVAREMGWRDKNEYKDKSGKPWIDAREFILRQRDFNERLQSKLESTETGVREIKNHFDRQLEIERVKIREELKTAKLEAIKVGDVDEVARIEEKMESVEPGVDGDTEIRTKQLANWKKDNAWYGEDDDLTETADALAKTYQEEGKSFPEILSTIDKKMKRLIPKSEEKKLSFATVEGESLRTTSAKKHTIRDLTEQQLNVLKIFKAEFPGTTDEKYIKQLEEQGVLA